MMDALEFTVGFLFFAYTAGYVIVMAIALLIVIRDHATFDGVVSTITWGTIVAVAFYFAADIVRDPEKVIAVLCVIIAYLGWRMRLLKMALDEERKKASESLQKAQEQAEQDYRNR